jgi:hypothetical protein
MCTVSYVPLSNNNFVLTSNRDESIHRQPAYSPGIESYNECQILYPKDAEKGGTWIGASSEYNVLCLLNGAFEKHTPTPPYRMSRGQVVKELLSSKNIFESIKAYNLNKIEPFTLIVINFNTDLNLYELKWDGVQKHITTLNEKQVYIWSSTTLYSTDEALTKELIFKTHIKPATQPESIFKFHEFATDLLPDLMLYNKDSNLKTLSITQIVKHNKELKMSYKDLIKGNYNIQNLDLKCKQPEV